MSNKLYGYDFFKSIGSPKYVVGPMVDQSELAWRLLGRKYGAHLTFTPMFHAANFVRDPTYRREAIEISAEDRPVIYQFCANDPDIFTEAARIAQQYCDAIDLNLGCPQLIAKRGHYGSYLQDDWELIARMLKKCVSEIDIPVTAKIRAQSSIELTVQYAKMIESCGISMLTIHGRTREQKGVNTGLADWSVIKAVKKALSIPVIANGNIQYYEDIDRCIQATGADGVMSAEGHLHNPAIFMPGPLKPVWQIANEYLSLAKQHPCNISYSRGHVFKLLHHALHCHLEIRELVASAKNIDGLIDAVNELEQICGSSLCRSTASVLDEQLPHRHWLCQPYIRPAATRPALQFESAAADGIAPPEIVYQSVDVGKSKLQRDEERRKKREARQLCKENKAKKPRQAQTPCENCSCNMRGLRCEHKLCKSCCKIKRAEQKVTCQGHQSSWKPPCQNVSVDECDL